MDILDRLGHDIAHARVNLPTAPSTPELRELLAEALIARTGCERDMALTQADTVLRSAIGRAVMFDERPVYDVVWRKPSP